MKKVTGLYCISDGGYYFWRILQFPVKMSSAHDVCQWSKRLESVDVERTFEALKMSFRILIHGLPYRLRGFVDKIFQTTCMFHNRLLAKADIARDEAWIAHDLALEQQASSACQGAVASSSAPAGPIAKASSQPSAPFAMWTQNGPAAAGQTSTAHHAARSFTSSKSLRQPPLSQIFSGRYGPEAPRSDASRQTTIRSAAAGALKPRRHSTNCGYNDRTGCNSSCPAGTGGTREQ
eukprot:1063507-Pleurochrysis_carterae.AAC.2